MATLNQQTDPVAEMESLLEFIEITRNRLSSLKLPQLERKIQNQLFIEEKLLRNFSMPSRHRRVKLLLELAFLLRIPRFLQIKNFSP